MPKGTIESTELNASLDGLNVNGQFETVELSVEVSEEKLSSSISIPKLQASLGEQSSMQTTRLTSIAHSEYPYIYGLSAEIGSDPSDPIWRARRTELISDTEAVTLWADGNYNFDNIADNYASLTYG